jgi:DNA-binding transcriptional ArsR family regulator
MVRLKFDEMINQINLKKASNIARAIAHPVRLSILKFISEQGTTNVNKIYNTLNLEQSITSQHLRILRTNELVNTQRDGKFINYSVNLKKVESFNNSLTEFFAKKLDISDDMEEDTANSGVKLNGVVKTLNRSQSEAR